MAHFEYYSQSSQVVNQTLCPSISLEYDEKKSEELIKEAAEKGIALAQMICGNNVWEDNKKEAVQWWEAAAKQGLESALFRLGLYYLEGDDVDVT